MSNYFIIRQKHFRGQIIIFEECDTMNMQGKDKLGGGYREIIELLWR